MLRCCYFALLLFVGCPLLFSATFSPDRILSDPPPRRIKIGSKPALPAFADGRLTLEIVVARDAVPVVRFAALELGRYLKRALGIEVPTVSEPDPVFTSLVLGDTAWSSAAEFDRGNALDGFCSKAMHLDLPGRSDDPDFDPAKLRQMIFLYHPMGQ